MSHKFHIGLHLKSGKKIRSDILLWANGRTGNTDDLGLDGFNTTHNYEGFCGCGYCADTIRAHMTSIFGNAELRSLFNGDFDGAVDVREPVPNAPEELKRRYLVVLEQAAARHDVRGVRIDWQNGLAVGIVSLLPNVILDDSCA